MHRRPRRLIPAGLLLLARARTLAALLWVGAAELARALAGAGAGFAVLLAAFAWLTVVGLAMTGSAITKATTVENRVDGLVPDIAAAKTQAAAALPKSGGTMTGSLTLSGSAGLTVGGNLQAAALGVGKAPGAAGTVSANASIGCVNINTSGDANITGDLNCMGQGGIGCAANDGSTGSLTVQGTLGVNSGRIYDGGDLMNHP